MFFPESCVRVIAATAIQHYRCIVNRTLLSDACITGDDVGSGEDIIDNGEPEVEGRQARQNLVNTHFSMPCGNRQ